MKVLFIASEAQPFIKSGGLGDVLGALPKYLYSNDDDIRIIIPKYEKLNLNEAKNIKFLFDFEVAVGWRKQYCGIFELKKENITYYLVDNEYYFKRENIYGYDDDGERFTYFCKAVLESIRILEWTPDILSCHDWQTALVPVLHKLEYSHNPFYRNMKTSLTIHNLAFQGIFEPYILEDWLGYDLEQFYNGKMEHNGLINFLKSGIIYSDKIITVSETYAQEIKTNVYGEGLESVICDRDDVIGIVNGIDYKLYNPATDKDIFINYSFDDLEKKYINKTFLQEYLGLPVKYDIPIIAIISRLTNQKGLDLLIGCMDRLLTKNIQLVILGTGNQKYEEHLAGLKYRYRDKVSINICFDNSLAHKIYAGSDLFLMPSVFEPCGLGQLIALRYGSLPIVRETGGLKDTILPYDKYYIESNGFSFVNYNSHELLQVVEKALNLYNDKNTWRSLVNNAMLSEHSWSESAKQYYELYKSMIN